MLSIRLSSTLAIRFEASMITVVAIFDCSAFLVFRISTPQS